MKGCGARMGRYKGSVVRVKRAKQRKTTIRPYGYEVNNPRRCNPRRSVASEYSAHILSLRNVLLVAGALFIYLWIFYYLFAP